MGSNALTSLASTNGLRDIKPPVEIPSGWEWVWWVLWGLAIALVIWAICRALFVKAPRVPPPPVPAHVRAWRQLEQALALIRQPKPFCSAVSDTIRLYLEERFEFRAPERTTEEFLHELQGTRLLEPGQKASLGEFLQACDLVKFARYEPGEPELRGLHGSAVRLVQETAPRPEPQPRPGEPGLPVQPVTGPAA
jgi:hypothetical protein